MTMTDAITIPMQPLIALALAIFMSVHAAAVVQIHNDPIPMDLVEAIGLIGGWVWWALILWLVVAP